MELTAAKTIGVLSVIFGCFAVLYPKIFHPMLMHSLGNSPPVHQDPRDERSFASHPTAGRPTPMNPGEPKNMRPGPHPGMRAAVESRKQAATTQGGGGKGMMSFVLPLYAVGIILYLIYTMTKVFSKKSKRSEDDYLAGHFSDVRYDSHKQRFRTRRARNDTDDDDDDLNDVQRTQRRAKQSQRELERLLIKADRNSINELEVTELKRRLMETEQQMSRLLQAMNAVSENVGSAAQQLNKMPEAGQCTKEEEKVDETEEPRESKSEAESLLRDNQGQVRSDEGHEIDDLRMATEADNEGRVSDVQGHEAVDKGHVSDIQGRESGDQGHGRDLQGHISCEEELSGDESEFEDSDSVGGSDFGSEDLEAELEELIEDKSVQDVPHDLRQRKPRSDPH